MVGGGWRLVDKKLFLAGVESLDVGSGVEAMTDCNCEKRGKESCQVELSV